MHLEGGKKVEKKFSLFSLPPLLPSGVPRGGWWRVPEEAEANEAEEHSMVPMSALPAEEWKADGGPGRVRFVFLRGDQATCVPRDLHLRA